MEDTMQTTANEKHLTMKQLADRWGVCLNTITRYRDHAVAAGTLGVTHPRFRRFGGKRGPVRYPLAEVELFEQRATVGGDGTETPASAGASHG